MAVVAFGFVTLEVRPQQRAALALTALGFVACATVLGIDDRKLDTQGADSSTDSPVDSSMESTADISTDGSMGNDVATLDRGATEAAASDGGSDRDASTAADGPGMDVAAMADSATGDGPSGDAQVDANTCPDPCLLASGLNHPFLMASDSNNVYWTEFGDTQGSGNGYVKACSVTGCAGGPVVYAQGVTNPRGIAVDSQNVYWASATYGGVNGGIWSCPLNTTNCTPTLLAPASIPYGVAVDSTFVYWVDNNDNTVRSVPKIGSPDSGPAVLYDAGDGVVYSPFQCVVDGPFLYFIDYDENAFRLPIVGGPLAYLGSGNNGSQYGYAFGITTDPTNVYFGGNGIILRADKMVMDSGAPIIATVPHALGLAYDPATAMIYWANMGSGNANDGTIGKMAVDGGNAQILASSLAWPKAVTVSGNYLFWLSNGVLDDAGTATVSSTGALLRRAK
jgi:hypothetical protein